MKILVKNTDKLVSLMLPKKVVNQYSIYVMGEETPLYAEIAYGETDRNMVINKLASKYLPDVPESEIGNHITEVSFFDFFNTAEDE